MAFRVLGPLEVCAGGSTHRLGSAKQRTLLAALLVEPGVVVTTERLVEVLWDQDPPPSARNSLQTYVARLRATFERLGVPARLASHPAGYALDVACDLVDATRFERLLGQARGCADPAEAEAVLDEALGLWRGPALPELAECAALRGAGLRLEELRLAAVQARVDARLALGRADEAIADLETTVAAQPLRERPHEQLVRALAADGRTAEAVQVCRDFRARLAEETGLDPSPRLARLERDVLRHDPVVDPAAGTAPGGTASPAGTATAAHGEGRARPLARSGAPWGVAQDEATATAANRSDRLPQSPTPLVGRDDDLADVASALGQAQLVTVTGPGGVGKTRLALEAARQHRRDPSETGRAGHGDVRLCELNAVADAGAVAHAVAAAIDLAVPPGQQALDQQAVVEALAHRRLLLVLDGCEHLLDAVASLADAVLWRCPEVALLATSRERLGVAGEHVRPLNPLGLPPADSGEVGAAPAVRLFVDRARAVRPGFALTEANAGAVAEVCRRLDGLPLAIELAAARTGALEPADLAARLDERFALLVGSRRAGETRHRTLRAVVDWSHQLLGDAEQAVFARASVFAGGFTLPLAEAVTAGSGVAGEHVAALLASLVDKSMVVAVHAGQPPRYRLLETLRAYAGERLVQRGEADATARAHARAMVGFAEHAAAKLATSAEAEWVARVDAELDDLRAAHRWARRAGDADSALRLSAALHRYGSWRLRREVLEWAEAAAALPDAIRHPAYPAACAAAGVAAWMRGDLAAARAHARAGLDAAGEDDAGPAARLWEVVGDVAMFQGHVDDGVAAYVEAHRLAEQARDVQTAAFNLVGQALARAYGGDARQALALAAAGHDRARHGRNPSGLAWGLYARAEALGRADAERALALLGDAVELAASVRNEFLVGVAEVSAASLRSRLGDPTEALRGFAALIDRWHASNNWTQQWTTLRNLVELLVRLGADEPAAVLYGASTAAPAGPRPYGAEAARLRDAAATARRRLGPPAYHAAVARGRCLAPEDVVALASDAVAGLLPHPAAAAR